MQSRRNFRYRTNRNGPLWGETDLRKYGQVIVFNRCSRAFGGQEGNQSIENCFGVYERPLVFLYRVIAFNVE